MPTPTEALQKITDAIKTNGKGAITASVLAVVLTGIVAIFPTMGTWNSSGVYTPSIPDGAITQGKLAPGVGGGTDASALTTGILNQARLPAFTGDVTSPAGTGAVTVNRVGGALPSAQTAYWNFLGGFGCKPREVKVAGAVTIGSTDCFVVINKTTTEATDVNFDCSTLPANFIFTVKDGPGVDGADGPITLKPPAGSTLDGKASVVMNSSASNNVLTSPPFDARTVQCGAVTGATSVAWLRG